MSLRKGVVFHNGEPFNAYDIEHLFQFANGQPSDMLIYQQWAPVQSVCVTDDYTVKFTLYRPDNYFLDSLALPMASIPNVRAYEESDGLCNPIGTGVFKYDQLIPGERLDFSRFEDYWGEEAPVETMTFKLIPELNTIPVESVDCVILNILRLSKSLTATFR